MKKMVPLLVAVVLALVLATASGAGAASSRVVAHGTCSGSSTWRLTLNYDHGKIEADNELRTAKSGQAWHMIFKANGTKFGSANRTTESDGSASATRYAANQPGQDSITVRSANQSTGEVCLAKAKI